MAAYVIANIDVKDPAGYEEYRRQAAAALAQYGGRFLSRGGETETLEGSLPLHRVVVLEFESPERAKQWWNSPEYGEARKIREKTAISEIFLVTGV